MRTLLSLFLVCTLPHLVLTQESAWERVYPPFPVNDIMDAMHWNGDTAYLAGNNWSLRMTTDAGASWVDVFDADNGMDIYELGADSEYLYLSVVPGELYWDEYSMDEYTLFRMEPGTSSPQTLHVPHWQPPLSSVSVRTFQYDISVNNQVVAALEVGRDSSAMHLSTDQGDTWGSRWLPDSVYIYYADRFHFFDAQRGALIGYVYHGGTWQHIPMWTEDAGVTWTYLDDVGRFTSSTVIIDPPPAHPDWFIIADADSFMVSEDWGASWTTFRVHGFTKLGGGGIHNVHFLDDETIVVIGEEMNVYKSTTGGAAWREVRSTHWQNVYLSSLGSAMIDGQTIIAGAEDGKLYRTTDASETWLVEDSTELTSIDHLHFFDLADGVCTSIGSHGLREFWLTSDGGSTWEFSAVNDDKDLAHLHYISKDKWLLFDRWSVVFPSRLYLSDDQGKFWERLRTWSTDDPQRPFTMEVYDAEHYYMPSGNAIHVTTDGGATWRVKDFPETSFYRYRDMEMMSEDVGFLATDSILYRTTNQWSTVEQVFDYTRGLIQYVTVLPDGGVLLQPSQASTNNIRYFSTDAGDTWQTIEQTSYLRGVGNYFADGVAFEILTGRAMRTTNDWWETDTVVFDKRSSGYYREMFWLDSRNGWIAGPNYIYRTHVGGVVGVNEPPAVPVSASLGAIYPHPVRPGQSVNIDITLPIRGAAGAPLLVRVYDMLGREVTELYNGPADPGTRTLTWRPGTLPAGLYFVKLQSPAGVETRKVVVR